MIADEDAALHWLRSLPDCDSLALERLHTFIAMLVFENKRQNLVSAASLSDVWRRHIVDSAQLVCLVPRETSPWLDIGSGAGFPGLIAACLNPTRPSVLVESRQLRARWLQNVVDALELAQVRVEGRALERVAGFEAGVISARAFAPLEKLIRVSLRFSTGRTIWLLPKGRSARHELNALRHQRHTFHVEQSITEPEAGIIVGTLAEQKEKRA